MLAGLFTLIPLHTWMQSKDVIFIKRFIIGFMAIIIVGTASIVYYIKAQYLPELEKKLAGQPIQLTPEELEKRITKWLLNTTATVTRTTGKDDFFSF